MLSLTGISQTELQKYAEKRIPVAVWVTRNYKEPTYNSDFDWILPDGSRYIPYDNLHCVVLTGMEGDSYRVADPINGAEIVDRVQFWSSFEAMGQRAVTVQAK